MEQRWVRTQKELARGLGLSIEEWLNEIRAASNRISSLMAVLTGVAASCGISNEELEKVNVAELLAKASGLLDPRPPRMENPVLREAVRRSEELTLGLGRSRLRGQRPTREEVPVPVRETRPIGESAQTPTADAPGVQGTSKKGGE